MTITLKKKRKKIWTAIPIYGGSIEIGCHKALMYDTFHAVMSGKYDVHPYELGHADIYLLRAQICEEFLNDPDADELVMIDSDVGWEQGGLLRLLEHDVDVVAGAYPKRVDPITFMFRSPMDEGKPLMGDPKTGLVEVYGMPGGFIRIKRHVLEKMREHYREQFLTVDGYCKSGEVVRFFDPYYWTDDQGRRRCLSEDYAFCQRWRDLGGKVYLDASIEMIHIGKKGFQGKLGEFINTQQAVDVTKDAAE